MKDIIDLKDRNQAFGKTDERLEKLRDGFYALSLDYGYHIENTSGGNHKIFELRDNVVYRLFSSLFHWQLLLKQHYIIEQNLNEIYKKDPSRFSNLIYPKKNPDFEYSEKEVTAIFDSIVFHLSSIFDYMSILINFICLKDKDQTPKWKVVSKSARPNSGNEFNKKDIAKVIDRIDREFTIKLYDYRSDLIHRRRDINEYSFETMVDTGQFNVRFICSDRIRKTFKSFGEINCDYTVSYFSMWLINKMADTISDILIALKNEIEQNSKFPFHTYKEPSKPFIVYVDPKTNVAKSPSIIYWQKFGEHFNGT